MVGVTVRTAVAASPPAHGGGCDVCGALLAQREAAREAGRMDEVGDCDRELREHGRNGMHSRHGRGCTP